MQCTKIEAHQKLQIYFLLFFYSSPALILLYSFPSRLPLCTLLFSISSYYQSLSVSISSLLNMC
jgi:hypothetical protein